MDLILRKLTFIHSCLVKTSSHACLLPVGVHLSKVILVNDLDGIGGVDGEHLLDPVGLEVEVGWASDVGQKAGELSGVLRGVKTLKLRDEAGVDDVGEDLVGDFLLC
jgi:hypothetical protein